MHLSSANFDTYGAARTALGEVWGAPTSWISSFAIDVSDDIEVLGLNENGQAAAWVKSYGGPEGTGFVSLTTGRVRFDALAAIQAMAEYGIR